MTKCCYSDCLYVLRHYAECSKYLHVTTVIYNHCDSGVYYKHATTVIYNLCDSVMYHKHVTTVNYNYCDSGMNYKHVTVVNYASSSLARSVNYNSKLRS